jgi:signal transduction histidine kinase/CheY-like chemotaxis protein
MKKIIRRKNTDSITKSVASPASAKPQLASWQILVVDDEPDIHAITKLALGNFSFAGRGLEIFSALSAAEAQAVLRRQPEIVVAMIDVVMETDDAGLQLVDFIRNELNNSLMRLVIRTGQPGLAPEKTVIDRYDIDDYKEKNELTETKLYTTLRLALKAHQTLQSLDTHRNALTKILDAAPELYHPQSIKHFFNGVLSQIISLCNLDDNSAVSALKSGFVATTDGAMDFSIHAGTGYFANAQSPEAQAIQNTCIACLNLNKDNPNSILSGQPLADNAVLIRLHVEQSNSADSAEGHSFIYLENAACLLKADKELLGVMAYQCAAALKNLQLFLELKAAHHQSSQLLSMAEHARSLAESANSAKTIFLAKMSHELRTPLNAIIGYTNLVEEEAEDFGYHDLLPDLKKIQSAGQQLLTMISDILDITQVESKQLSLDLTQFPLEELTADIETLIRPLIDKHDNQLDIVYHGKPGCICSDKAKLKQILLNLLHNANKFTRHGHVALHIGYQHTAGENVKQCDPPLSDICEHCDSAGFLSFKVSDTGIGIPDDQFEAIFETFSQIDKTSASDDGTTPGAGLGLTISRQLCHVLGGNISVASEIGKGATFTVNIPINVTKA